MLASFFQSLFEGILMSAVNLILGLIRGVLGAPRAAAERLVVRVRRARSEEVIGVRHRVLRQGRPIETAHLDGDQEPESRHWVAERGDDIVGVVTVIKRTPPGESRPTWQLRGMAVLFDLQQGGVGSALLKALSAEVAEPIWCNARVAAMPFYEKHGWVGYGDVFDKPPTGPHQRMKWSP
jgi:GNAT superfamily N-acetyltransferase